MALTVCVTGGTGFLGRRLVRILQDKGLQVRCLVRDSSDVSVLRDSSGTTSGSLEIVKASLTSAEDLRTFLAGADVVYHVAAALGGSTSTMFLNTVVPTRTLIAAALEANVGRFVLVSSMGVYGTASLGNGGTLDENCPVDPRGELRDPYTFSKIRQEEVAWQAHREQQLPLVVVRPGVIYGPGRSLLTSRVGLGLGPLFLKMGGSQQLPFTHVENCAHAMAEAGLKDGIVGQALNVVDDDLPTGSQILRLLKRHGKRPRTVWIPRPFLNSLAWFYETYSNWSQGQLPPVFTRYKCNAMWKPLRYSNAKTRQLLGWVPVIKTAQGLQQTIEANSL